MTLDPDRGTGRTTALIHKLPQRSFLLIASQERFYITNLLRYLGRLDLHLITFKDLYRLQGLQNTVLGIDHYARELMTADYRDHIEAYFANRGGNRIKQ